MNRSKREKFAYDQGEVFLASDRYHKKFSHVFRCPNSMRNGKLFEELIESKISNARVLEIGCGTGWFSPKILSLGASYVCGIDISKNQIKEAKKNEIKGKLEFKTHNVEEKYEGNFDLIIGRAILHHINYKKALGNLFCSLNPNGIMIFMEPLGSNILLRLFRFLIRSAHTHDEKPFTKDDLKWLNAHFKKFTYYPFNYFSLFFGLFSSVISRNPENNIMVLCDKIDCWIAENLKIFRPNFRAAIFVIEKMRD